MSDVPLPAELEGSQTFAHLLRQHLDGRDLGVTTAAALWHVDPDTLHKILRGAVSVPKTKIGFWSQIFELPEEIVLAAVNATRASLGRTLLAPPRDEVGIPIHTVDQAQAVVADLPTHAPMTPGQNRTAATMTTEVIRAQ